MLEGVSIVDSEGRIIEWNPAQEQISGIARTEAIGMYVWDLATRMIPDPDRRGEISSRIKEEIISTIKSGTSTQPEMVNYRFCRPDGTIAIANQMVFIIKTHEGNMLGTLNQDITRHRLAEEKIQESESSYRGIFNTIQQAIYILDPEGKFIDVNEGAEVMYGYSREEFIGKTPEFLSAPGKNDFAVVIRKIHMALAGEPQRLEFWGLRKNNEIFPKDVRLYKGEYFSKDVIIAVGTDISERKQAELELLSTQERLKEAHRLAHIGTWAWVMEDDTVTWSEELYHIAGRDFSLPAPPYEEHPALYTPSSWILLNGAVHRAVTTGEPYNLELELVRPDGSIRWTNEFGGVNRDEDGKIIGLHGTVQDITERKKNEEALREANKKLNLLSGITRHDINNQLTVLMGYLEMLEDLHEVPPFNTYCQEAITAARRIATMIQFTKEYEQLGVYGPVWQNIGTIAKIAAVELLPDNVQLTLNTGDHEIFADPMFIMVLYNLFENATRHGGDVTEITSSFIEEENAGTLIIEDNGTGVPASLKEKIFERGFGANTGFGLYLTHEILPITGLSIKETGTEGKGARFEIHLPPGTWRRGSR